MLSSGLSVTLLVLFPRSSALRPNNPGGAEAPTSVITSLLTVLITATESVCSSATYRLVWDAFRVIFKGWPLTLMRLLTAGVPEISTTTTSRSRILETYAVVFPFTVTQNGYSPPGVPDCAGLILPGRRSNSAVLIHEAPDLVSTEMASL